MTALTKQVLRTMADILTQDQPIYHGHDIPMTAQELLSMLEDAHETALERLRDTGAEEEAADLKLEDSE